MFHFHWTSYFFFNFHFSRFTVNYFTNENNHEYYRVVNFVVTSESKKMAGKIDIDVLFVP